jgi:hypothetical protein
MLQDAAIADVLVVVRRLLTDAVTIEAVSPTGFGCKTRAGDRVLVDLVRGVNTWWLVLQTPISPEGELHPRLTLVRAGRLALSTIVLRAGEYLLRFAVPCDSDDARELQPLIELVVEAGQALRPRLSPPAGGARNLFAAYAT